MDLFKSFEKKTAVYLFFKSNQPDKFDTLPPTIQKHGHNLDIREDPLER